MYKMVVHHVNVLDYRKRTTLQGTGFSTNPVKNKQIKNKNKNKNSGKSLQAGTNYVLDIE